MRASLRSCSTFSPSRSVPLSCRSAFAPHFPCLPHPFCVPCAPILRGSSRLWRAFRVAPHVACIHVHASIHPSTHSAYMCALYVFPARAHAVFARLSQGRRHVTHGMCSLAARQVCWRHQRMLVWVTLKLPSLLPPRSSPEYKVRMHAPDARLPPSPCTRPRSSPLRV